MNTITTDKKCKYCGKTMENVQSSRRKYCDDVCRGRYRRKHAHKTGTYKVTCGTCGDTFRTYHDSKKYCTKECRNKSYTSNPEEKLKREKLKHKISCKECGNNFETSHSSMKFCSNYCRQRNKDRQSTLKRRKYYQDGDTSISIDKLIKQDGNSCYLCNYACDIDDYTVSEEGTIICGNNYPSIDHVIPLSKGGKHEWNNVKLAHRICNIRKSNN